MATIYDVDPSVLIEKTAEELKKLDSIKPPVWAAFAKTGMHKERPPVKNDWWYARSASILRQIYRYSPIGVSKLRTMYGGKKNRGYRPEHFFKGSGSIIRKVLQQFEKEGFIRQDLKSVHKGRVITAKGKKFLDGIASNIYGVKVERAKEAPKEEIVKKEPKAEHKEEKKEIKKEEAPKDSQ